MCTVLVHFHHHHESKTRKTFLVTAYLSVTSVLLQLTLAQTNVENMCAVKLRTDATSVITETTNQNNSNFVG